ncbi:TIGR04063 family PEP-CTERM/XrtA system glycosyltransferase [Sphingomonas sp. 28-62-11]|uniref:TIGR04063 family PEP-CTERM/XrtA system glycosyltransferase n=1 Tax=Sphingomonas sp. 28-62-11 TaxID=1970432 RepID=UPI000BCFE083|nr:MAG: glycosyltransferase, exosortase A system-associated [Sphingomonas sp. 28-62-11]
MRILHILDHGLPLQSGYTFRTRAILKAQMARGFAVAAVTGPRHGGFDAERETVDGIDFYRTEPPKPLASPFGELREISAFSRRIKQVVRDFEPDVLHAHSPVLDAIAARRASRRYKVPLLYEIRAFWEDAAVGNETGTEGSWRYRATRALETRMVRKVDGVAVICEGLKSDLVARGINPGQIMVSPNGVDMTLFGAPMAYDAMLAQQLGIVGDEVIGFIGSFYAYEGLADLIAAMPRLVSARPRIKLVLVGGGPCEEALRAQAAESAVAEHIHFVGRVPHQQVERYYSVIDVLVYPRKRMRLTDLVTPLKPLEAMAQGRLVAASDVGGHRELIRDGDTGTLFAPDDPKAMARAISSLFADRETWPARRARARAFVEAERNWANNVARYVPVYQKLIESTDRLSPWLKSPAVNA